MHHAKSSAKRFGGVWEDYIKIHNWFDETKANFADVRHRAMRHHAEGIFWCEKEFGTAFKNSNGQDVPTRAIGEQHVKEDCGFIPSMQRWLLAMNVEEWMIRMSDKSKETFDMVREDVNMSVEAEEKSTKLRSPEDEK